MASTETKTVKNVSVDSGSSTVLILLDFLPPIQELRHLLIYVGIRNSIAKFDVNYGFSLYIP